MKVKLRAMDLPPGEHTLNVITTTAEGEVMVRRDPVSFEQPFPGVFWVLFCIAIAILGGCVVRGVKAWRNWQALQ